MHERQGALLTKPRRHRSRTMTKPEQNQAGGRDRPCMCCERVFRSTWIGNRLCHGCNRRGHSAEDL